MYVDTLLKCPEQGEWFALTRVTADGDTLLVAYLTREDVEKVNDGSANFDALLPGDGPPGVSGLMFRDLAKIALSAAEPPHGADAEKQLRIALDHATQQYVRIAELDARVAELEAALHDIANRTWNIQYETGVVRQTVRFACGLYAIASRAVHPPVSKGTHAEEA